MQQPRRPKLGLGAGTGRCPLTYVAGSCTSRGEMKHAMMQCSWPVAQLWNWNGGIPQYCRTWYSRIENLKEKSARVGGSMQALSCRLSCSATKRRTPRRPPAGGELKITSTAAHGQAGNSPGALWSIGLLTIGRRRLGPGQGRLNDELDPAGATALKNPSLSFSTSQLLMW
jgi:hypothetical protein